MTREEQEEAFQEFRKEVQAKYRKAYSDAIGQDPGLTWLLRDLVRANYHWISIMRLASVSEETALGAQLILGQEST